MLIILLWFLLFHYFCSHHQNRYCAPKFMSLEQFKPMLILNQLKDKFIKAFRDLVSFFFQVKIKLAFSSNDLRQKNTVLLLVQTENK